MSPQTDYRLKQNKPANSLIILVKESEKVDVSALKHVLIYNGF
jgi:hypothetical protein